MHQYHRLIKTSPPQRPAMDSPLLDSGTHWWRHLISVLFLVYLKALAEEWQEQGCWEGEWDGGGKGGREGYEGV